MKLKAPLKKYGLKNNGKDFGKNDWTVSDSIIKNVGVFKIELTELSCKANKF